VVIGLGLTLIVVLIGPIFIKPVERNIELFFLGVGAQTSIITRQFGWALLHAAVTEPIALTIAVLVFGVLARILRPAYDRGVERLRAVVSDRWIYFTLALTLGLLSSVLRAGGPPLAVVEAHRMHKRARARAALAAVTSHH